MDFYLFKKSVFTQRVQLSSWEKLSHYLPALAVFNGVVMGVYTMVTADNEEEIARGFNVIIPCFVLTIIISYIQWKRLRFTVIETSLDSTELAEVIKYVEKRQKWDVTVRSTTFYIATADEGALFQSWGERITILYYENRIYFSSICDPNKRTSLSSWGRNWENLDIFKRAVVLLEEDIMSKSATT